jgi:molybdenum cofactor cytidylyltransferase
MKFRRVTLTEAEGHILGHNVVHDGRRVLKKGRRLAQGELAALARAGHDSVYVAMLEPTDVEEDAAALRIARAVADAGGLIAKPAYGGRVSLLAPEHGVLSLERDRLLELNLLDGVTLAALPAHRVVASGEHVATLKVIPFALPEATVRAAEELAAARVLGLRPLHPRRVSLLVCGAASRRGRLFDAYRAPLGERIGALGSHRVNAAYVVLADDPERELAAAIGAELDQAVDLLIVVSETATMDAEDLAPRAIRRAGGQVDVVGAPVFPGNLLLLGHRERSLILGAPGCVRSRATNVVDLLLPRLLVGDRLERRDVAELAHGGLLHGGDASDAGDVAASGERDG